MAKQYGVSKGEKARQQRKTMSNWFSSEIMQEYARQTKRDNPFKSQLGIRFRVIEAYEKHGMEAAWEVVQNENTKLSGHGVKYTYQMFLGWIKQHKKDTRAANVPKRSEVGDGAR